MRPPRRLPISEFRGAIWRMIIEILRAIHADRFPKGNRFGADVEQLLLYGAAVMLYLEGRQLRTSKLAHYLDLPNETARRHVDKLIQYRLLEREDHSLRLPPQIARIPKHHREMAMRLLQQACRTF